MQDQRARQEIHSVLYTVGRFWFHSVCDFIDTPNVLHIDRTVGFGFGLDDGLWCLPTISCTFLIFLTADERMA
jgi:hypothetical protein